MHRLGLLCFGFVSAISLACSSAGSGAGTAGHYTQVVWRSSVRIGCAIVDCPNVTFHSTVLCDYSPGGNIQGQKPY